MPTVAEQLHTAREQQGFTVHQLADVTKIRTDHIRALEEGNYHVFAAPVYIRGFVRSCAGILKMDAQVVLSTLDEELSKIEKFREHPRLTGQPRGWLDLIMLQLSKLNWKVLLPLLAISIGVVTIIFVYRSVKLEQSKDPLRNLGSGQYQPARKQTGETLPLPPASPVRQP